MVAATPGAACTRATLGGANRAAAASRQFTSWLFACPGRRDQGLSALDHLGTSRWIEIHRTTPATITMASGYAHAIVFARRRNPSAVVGRP
jgi:hypothetical protein